MVENASENKTPSIGNSAFWILIYICGLIGVAFLGIWAYHENSIQGTIISALFFGMILAGGVLTRFNIFDEGNWGDNTLSFVIGFGVYFLLNKVKLGQMSIFSISENTLFSTISGELPLLHDFVVSSFIVPIAEELFFMIGLPYAIITLMNITGKKYAIFKNELIQIVVIALVAGISFSLFHVGKALSAFFYIALAFRAGLVVVVYGEKFVDLIKWVNITVAFALGLHIANNIFNKYSFSQVGTIITSSFFTVGWIIVALGILFLLGGIDRLIELIVYRGRPNEE